MSTADKNAALITMARALISATNVGSPSPVVRWLGDWMRSPPKLGDLVIETSTMYRGDIRCIGFFIKHEVRAICEHEAENATLDKCTECPDENGTECPDDDDCSTHRHRHRDLCTWIRVLEPSCGKDQCDDSACIHRLRWSNASFVRLPATQQQLFAATAKPL
jgi:hypothetical protein